MKKIRIGLIIYLILFLFSCSGNKKTVLQKIESDSIAQYNDKNEQLVENDFLKESETAKPRRELKNPLVFYKQYDFIPVEGININEVVYEKTDDKTIKILYQGNNIITIDDLNFEDSSVFYHNKTYNRDRQLTSSFCVFNGNIKYYDAIVSFNKGFVKIYKSTDTEYNIDGPFYSGYSDYYYIYDKWMEKDSYYDYKTFQTIPAVYDGEILLIDINTDEIIYSICSKVLHDYVLLITDEIKYEDDGIRIILGDRMDSDEFVDFKLYTADDDFHYEIYDKYEYDR